jgi:hypothetical protein
MRKYSTNRSGIPMRQFTLPALGGSPVCLSVNEARCRGGEAVGRRSMAQLNTRRRTTSEAGGHYYPPLRKAGKDEGHPIGQGELGFTRKMAEA